MGNGKDRSDSLTTESQWSDAQSELLPERRCEKRVKAPHSGELTIVELGVQSGLLLDVSAGGIAVQAVFATKVGNDLPIYFCPAKSDHAIETNGKVVWVDGANQCGLKFSGLDTLSQRALRAWLETQPHDRESVFPHTPATPESHKHDRLPAVSNDVEQLLHSTAINKGQALRTSFQLRLLEPIMKSIQEVLRQKEIELQQVVDQAVREKEVQLRELKSTLLTANDLVNSLLECEGDKSLKADVRTH